MYCRPSHDIGYLLQSELLGDISIFAGISKSQTGCCGYKKDVWARSFAQVSGKLQRSVAVARKQNYCCFLQPAVAASSNETIKNDFLDRRGRLLY